MAFDDAALERALRAETKHGLTLYCNGETLTALGYEWMAVVPMDGLRERLRGTLGALVEMLGYIPENDTVWIVRNKGGYLVQPELPETVGEEICGYAGETHTEEIRPTGLRMGMNFLMQKKNGEIVGVVPRGANLDVRRYAITPGGSSGRRTATPANGCTAAAIARERTRTARRRSESGGIWK